MNNIIAYPIGDSLYLNLTNRCTNACAFCVRTTTDSGMGYDLWIDKEPAVEEMVADIKAKGIENYKELVLCGYGEPTERYSDMLEVVRQIKAYCPVKVRLNTNGHANLIAGRDVTDEMEGLIDIVSISLNAPDARKYQEICRCQYGEEGFYGMLDFAKRAKEYVPEVVFSVVDVMDKEDIDSCRQIAEEIGVRFRVRELIK
ncbi:MAG: TatD family nuclease-associated radical SAM protein [Clostridia bacterium]|nr:TatD family nuclease-associated radical SAM protein [Clostridia bacterium]